MEADAIERHTISVLVDNEAGVLARVIGLFSGRGYNIESLTVAEVDTADTVSRITLVTSGTPMTIGVPVVTTVIRDNMLSASVSATVRLSML